MKYRGLLVINFTIINHLSQNNNDFMIINFTTIHKASSNSIQVSNLSNVNSFKQID